MNRILALLTAALAFVAMLYRGRLVETERDHAEQSAEHARIDAAKAQQLANTAHDIARRRDELKTQHIQEANSDQTRIDADDRTHFDSRW